MEIYNHYVKNDEKNHYVLIREVTVTSREILNHHYGVDENMFEKKFQWQISSILPIMLIIYKQVID